jgi:hypothetical protein
MTLDEYFSDRSESRCIFEGVWQAIADCGHAEMRISKSQIAFRRRINFAFVWIPGMYLKSADVPIVLTIGLPRRDDSPRWKQIVEPTPGRFTHHLELRSVAEVDREVSDWLKEAWDGAT